MLTPELKQLVDELTNPPPIDDRVFPARWSKFDEPRDEDGNLQGFIFPEEGTPGYEFMMDASQESFVEGPFAVGKSQLLAFKIHWKCLKEPGSVCGFLRKTKESVKGSIIPTYYRVLGYDPTQSKRNYVTGYGGANPQRFMYRNGSMIKILGLNRLDDFLSTEFSAIGIPQAEELNQDEWTLVARRTRLGEHTQVFGDVNPSFPQHFLNNSDHIIRYKMTHEENPEYWDREVRDWTEKGRSEIEKLQRMVGTRYKRGYLGLWCAQEGVVYEMYDSDKHDIEIPNVDYFSADTKWNMSVDFGFENPWACSWWAMDPNGVHYHFKEIYKTKIILDDFIEMVRDVERRFKIPKPDNCFTDHDAEHNAKLTREGFPVTKADKHGNLLSGIDKVKTHLENGTVKFNIHAPAFPVDENLFGHPKCLRDELGVYSYRPEDQRTYTDKDEYPIEYANHSMDEMRYYFEGMDPASTYFEIFDSYSMSPN